MVVEEFFAENVFIAASLMIIECLFDLRILG